MNKLWHGNILGIIDANGAVHSKFTGEELEWHSSYWPTETHWRWRWNNNKSIYWLLKDPRPDEEQWDAIRNHLTKKYNILWWDNGHHDIDHLRSLK